MGREFTGESAFVDAYSEYFDVVYREALRYSGNHHVAEEIAQDAFFMAYVQNGNESKQQIKAWMLMLAKYRAMNYIRDISRTEAALSLLLRLREMRRRPRHLSISCLSFPCWQM